MNKIYLLVGCPGSGKSWAAEQLTHKFEYVRHDDYQDGGYVEAIVAAANGDKPVLCETPFSVSQIMSGLLCSGKKATPVFILDDPKVISARYKKRTGRDIIPGHLTRQKTYAERARDYQAFSGTSEEVLEHLKSL